MTMRLRADVSVAAACANELGEGPLWDATRGALWWVDISRATLWCLTGQQAQHWVLPAMPACLGLHDSGKLWVVGRRDAGWFDPSDGQWTAAPPQGIDWSVMRFNDGRADAAGRFWAGTMDRRMQNPVGGLYQTGDGVQWQQHDSGVTLANGLGWSPDQRTMYFTDTPARRIVAYPFDVADGVIGAGRTLVHGGEGELAPDGLAVDADGGIWSAQFGLGCLHRYTPSGQLDQVIELPVSRPTSVAFGGADLRSLYITTATLGLTEAERAAEPLAGHTLVWSAEVSGQPEHAVRFS